MKWGDGTNEMILAMKEEGMGDAEIVDYLAHNGPLNQFLLGLLENQLPLIRFLPLLILKPLLQIQQYLLQLVLPPYS
jgi:hypothetical protein